MWICNFIAVFLKQRNDKILDFYRVGGWGFASDCVPHIVKTKTSINIYTYDDFSHIKSP